MKRLSYFLVLLLFMIFYSSCQKEEYVVSRENNASTNILIRSYNQEDCGFIEAFCSEQVRRGVKAPDIVQLVAAGGDETTSLMPVQLYDGSIAIHVVRGGNEYFVIDASNQKMTELATQKRVPSVATKLLQIPYQDIENGNQVLSEIQANNEVTVTQNATGAYIISDNSDTDVGAIVVVSCDYYKSSRVEMFIDVFFQQQDASHIKGFVESAFLEAEANSDCMFGGSYDNGCRYNCVDPRCVVDNLLQIDAGLSDYQKRVLVSRYLDEALGLTDEEQNWLTLNGQSDLIYDIYNGLADDINLGRCDKEDCGMAGGYHELIKQTMAGETLTANETADLLEFFSVMSCDDPEIYGCFREAQRNPNSEIAAFLNAIKTRLQNNPNELVDGCSDLEPYATRWEWLSTFDPNSVQSVKNKLKNLGEEEYWIQTIENATNQKWWWQAAPTVNMDFFGITITTLPNKPYPPFDQFTADEFFEFMQSKFIESDLMGSGSECVDNLSIFLDGGFIPLNSFEETRWQGNNPLTTVMEISMIDDGNVICTDYNPGENWTFSTLNAPGWLEGDSWDGFHPVSGNRQFGIIDNGDGTYTFYSSGVDRLTGFWHSGFGFAPDLPFDQAEKLWKCFLDQISSLVEGLGGEVSNDYDFTNVRPDIDSLQDLITQGCAGDPASFEDFPCHQTSECP